MYTWDICTNGSVYWAMLTKKGLYENYNIFLVVKTAGFGLCPLFQPHFSVVFLTHCALGIPHFFGASNMLSSSPFLISRTLVSPALCLLKTSLRSQVIGLWSIWSSIWSSMTVWLRVVPFLLVTLFYVTCFIFFRAFITLGNFCLLISLCWLHVSHLLEHKFHEGRDLA